MFHKINPFRVMPDASASHPCPDPSVWGYSAITTDWMYIISFIVYDYT